MIFVFGVLRSEIAVVLTNTLNLPIVYTLHYSYFIYHYGSPQLIRRQKEVRRRGLILHTQVNLILGSLE